MTTNRLSLFSVLLLSVFLLYGCSNNSEESKKETTNVRIQGAGSTFSAPLYSKWIQKYVTIHPKIQISYDSVGSGEGIQRFIAHTVDFGASDAAMKDSEMAKVDAGVQLIPATAGAIVLAYNIPDLDGKLRLSRKVYVDIFLGNIRYWNDPRIQADNPGLNLPQLNIVTVVRRDSSGTTWAFTNHLSTISAAWRNKGPGTGKVIDFPGNAMSVPGNGGVASEIQRSWGSIGYMEYGFAKRLGLPMALLENQSGNFIEPNDSALSRTLANTVSEMPANLRLFLPDPKGKDSYPLVTYSWLLLYKQYDDGDKKEALLNFIRWGLSEEQQYAAALGYVSLPEKVAALGLKALDNIH